MGGDEGGSVKTTWDQAFQGMTDLIRIALVFVLLVILLRKRVPVGYTLLAGSGGLALIYMMPFDKVLLSVKNTFTKPITYELLIALTCIRGFEMVLRQERVLEGMMNAVKNLLKNKRAVVVTMPLLIGMLPSVGGAYFSAPMVDEATKDLSLKPEEKAFANYWYRHPWEFILPLYPGIVLGSALTGIKLRDFIVANLPYAIVMFGAGFVYLSKIKGMFEVKEGKGRDLLSFIPIVVLLFAVMILGVALHWALLVILVLMLLYWRYNMKALYGVLKHSVSLNIIFLTIGVVLFKEVLEVSGAVENLSHFFEQSGVPFWLVLFALPFITGVLTGVTVGFVSATFPLLVSMVGSSLPELSFAFASGYAGVLLSPVHVCLILTKEYFRADMGRIYRKTVPLTVVILSVAILEYALMMTL